MTPYQELVWYIRERERIRDRKESKCGKPWTTDTVLQSARFCNVWREDDRVTRYERSVTDGKSQLEQLQAILFLRHTNSIKAFEEFVVGADIIDEDDNDDYLVNDAMICWESNRPARSRLMYVDAFYHYIYSDSRRKVEELHELLSRTRTGELAHEAILAFRKHADAALGFKEPYYGYNPFWAYEIYTSLTSRIWFGPTQDDFVHLGPGVFAAIDRLYPRDLFPNRTTYMDDFLCLTDVHRSLLHSFEYDPIIRASRRKWTLRNTEHNLCEWRKYFQIKHENKPIRRPYVESKEVMP